MNDFYLILMTVFSLIYGINHLASLVLLVFFYFKFETTKEFVNTNKLRILLIVIFAPIFALVMFIVDDDRKNTRLHS